MKRLPDWTLEEFEILFNSNNLSAENLSNRLSQRTPDAITIVRNGIHEFHQKGDSSFLSKMMKNYIEKIGTNLICPVCSENISTGK